MNACGDAIAATYVVRVCGYRVSSAESRLLELVAVSFL